MFPKKKGKRKKSKKAKSFIAGLVRTKKPGAEFSSVRVFYIY